MNVGVLSWVMPSWSERPVSLEAASRPSTVSGGSFTWIWVVVVTGSLAW